MKIVAFSCDPCFCRPARALVGSSSAMASLPPNWLSNSNLVPRIFAEMVTALMAPLVALLWIPATVAFS